MLGTGWIVPRKLMAVPNRCLMLRRKTGCSALPPGMRKWLGEQKFAHSIIVTLLGTIYSVTYFKPRGSPGLLAMDIANENDPRVSMACADFLASAWRTANDKAREIGWIA